MRRPGILVVLALVAVASACSSGKGGVVTARSSCKTYLALNQPSRDAVFRQLSQQVGNKATDARTEASLHDLCSLNGSLALGTAVQKVSGEVSARPPTVNLTSPTTVAVIAVLPAIAAASLPAGQLPHETLGDQVKTILANKLALFHAAACTKNAGLLVHVLADTTMRSEYASAITSGRLGCPSSVIKSANVQAQSSGHIVVGIDGTGFISGIFDLQWTGTEWLVAGPPQ